MIKDVLVAKINFHLLFRLMHEPQRINVMVGNPQTISPVY